jgi:MFS family permease
VDALAGLVPKAPELTAAVEDDSEVATPPAPVGAGEELAHADPQAVALATGAAWMPAQLEALRYRDFRLLLGGLFLALSGWWMIIVAQGWLVLEMTNSAAMVALAGAMLSFPFLILGPFSGVIADRVYRKHLLVGTRSAVSALMFFEGALILSGQAEVWHLMVLAFASGCAFAMDIPARQSLIPDTVPTAVVANAVAVNVALFSLTTIAGPIAGALTLTAFGAGGCFIANGVGNAALAASIGGMRIPRRARSGAMSMTGDFLGGVRYVRSQPVLLLLLAIGLILTLTGRNWQQLAPVFVRDVYLQGEGGLGIIYTAAGIGAAIGAIALVPLSGVQRRAPLLAGGLAIAIGATMAFALSPSLLPAVACVLVIGIGLQVIETLTQTVLLVETPEHFRGRVMSISSLLWGLQPLGVLIAGVVADIAGPQIAIGGGAAVAAAFLGVLYTRMRPAWRVF